jgi:hypothetical protein
MVFFDHHVGISNNQSTLDKKEHEMKLGSRIMLLSYQFKTSLSKVIYLTKEMHHHYNRSYGKSPPARLQGI